MSSLDRRYINKNKTNRYSPFFGIDYLRHKIHLSNLIGLFRWNIFDISDLLVMWLFECVKEKAWFNFVENLFFLLLAQLFTPLRIFIRTFIHCLWGGGADEGRQKVIFFQELPKLYFFCFIYTIYQYSRKIDQFFMIPPIE